MTLSLFVIAVLVALPMVGVGLVGFQRLFGIIIPYAAFFLFLAGFVWRIINWALSPVPFHIPTVCGQQKSLPWIKTDNKESPWTRSDVIVTDVAGGVFFQEPFQK